MFIISILSLFWCISYRLFWLSIPAKNEFWHTLGQIAEPIFTSVIASGIFYFITVYFPYQKKKKNQDYYIRKWLQQIVFYGDLLLEDIAGDKNITLEEFKKKCCFDLKSIPNPKISIREGVQLTNWFDYFHNFHHWLSVYQTQVLKYGDSIPAEVISKFEKYDQFDNLKSAILTYEKNYDKSSMYQSIAGFSLLIYLRAQSMRNLLDLYDKHSRL